MCRRVAGGTASIRERCRWRLGTSCLSISFACFLRHNKTRVSKEVREVRQGVVVTWCRGCPRWASRPRLSGPCPGCPGAERRTSRGRAGWRAPLGGARWRTALCRCGGGPRAGSAPAPPCPSSSAGTSHPEPCARLTAGTCSCPPSSAAAARPAPPAPYPHQQNMWQCNKINPNICKEWLDRK